HCRLVQALTNKIAYTNQLVINGDRCAIKSVSMPGDAAQVSRDWEVFSTPRPPREKGYFINLDSPPHVEIQQLVGVAGEITKEPGAFLLTLRTDDLAQLRRQYRLGRI